PRMKNTACRMCTPYSPSPNRLAKAQPAAKAAPNTSAPIRIAALTTVSTWIQITRRFCLKVAFILNGSRRRAARRPQSPRNRRGDQEQAFRMLPLSRRVALGLGVEQSRLHQRGADAVDLGPGKLDQRRTHYRARQAA